MMKRLRLGYRQKCVFLPRTYVVLIVAGLSFVRLLLFQLQLQLWLVFIGSLECFF